jgi:NAD(P)-dependent dehydrogenase (short-subunit alcohol dehydrogenase family)
MARFESKVAVVTGGGSGIGRATSLAFAAEAARVVVVDRAAEAAEATRRAIADAGGQAIAVAADVSRGEDVRGMVDETVRAFDRLDVLFNNAGVLICKTLEETEEHEWDAVLDVNLKAIYLCSRAAIPVMRRGGGGAIVNTASVHSQATAASYAAYAASKGGVLALTRQMAIDLGRENIRVNCVMPGAIDTAMMTGDPAFRVDPERARRDWAARHVLGRIGRPEEVARVVLFLASEDASFVTGGPVLVDGGMLARL